MAKKCIQTKNIFGFPLDPLYPWCNENNHSDMNINNHLECNPHRCLGHMPIWEEVKEKEPSKICLDPNFHLALLVNGGPKLSVINGVARQNIAIYHTEDEDRDCSGVTSEELIHYYNAAVADRDKFKAELDKFRSENTRLTLKVNDLAGKLFRQSRG